MRFQEHHYLMVRGFSHLSRHKGLNPGLGMAKASADCIGEAHGGFASDGSDISGFSHMVCLCRFTLQRNPITDLQNLVLSTTQGLGG
jgi:hypothetical protein